MYKLESLNDINLSLMDYLNVPTEHKKELKELYRNKNIIKKLLFRKEVRFLKENSKYIGFIWFNKIGKNSYRIHCINLLPSYRDKEYYELLFSFFDNNAKFIMCHNENYFDINQLKEIGVIPDKIIFEMKKSIDGEYEIPIRGISFEQFRAGKDEKKRCMIQNLAFSSIDRTEIKEEDIIFEQYQKYYIPRGSIFINYYNEPVGYGQIIKQDNKMYIVNLGILPRHRNKKLGDVLLNHLMNVIYSLGYNEVYLKCQDTNIIAFNLYKSKGFEVINTYHEFKRKSIKA